MSNKIGRQTPTNSYIILYKNTLGNEAVELYNNTIWMYVDKHYVYGSGSSIYIQQTKEPLSKLRFRKQFKEIYLIRKKR